ncbi:PE-PPE domain-containing protein [Mycobacterium sp. IS-1496]|uniref:PE-PPE domain-containing protein n=1 Tax=Mycobacterium sp. IS-1496 TaxID=1772284 RepID=UPI00257121EC|nr:PE-PPE domain-containing protein [Mycobacterium sp. IS-1496]
MRKAAVAGGAAVTATALTMGLTAPSAAAAATASEVRAYETQRAAFEDANLGFLLEALGLDVPGLDELLPIPTTIPGLPGVELPINVITTGPPFGALALFGLNPFWVPAFPSAIADEINGTPYGGIDTALRTTVFGLPVSVPLELVNLRVPIVIAFGLGSLATGMAYPDVVADLPNQPGGTAEGAPDGTSLTILPLILLRNPGRADGGIAARFAPVLDPILGLFGQNSVVTPEVDVETDGGAVLVPIKVDGTVEYDPLSDFAAWPNPFTLANNGAAFLFPTYILRGADLTGALPDVLEPLLGSVAGNLASGIIGDGLTVSSPLGSIPLTRAQVLALVGGLLPGIDIPAEGFEALNLFFTVESDALPLLEPFRYPTDIANLFTGGAFGFTNPFADAIEPALKILVNLGYTNVTQDMTNPLDPYPRDFSGNFGSEYAPFLTLPEGVEWERVPEDLVTAFAAGVRNSFFTGIPGVRGPLAGPNPLAIIAGLLGLPTGPAELPDLLNAFPDLAGIIGGNLGLPDLNSTSALAAAAAPSVGGSDDPLTRLGETLARTLNIAFEREAPVEYTPPTSPVDSAFDVSEGLSASGLRLLAATVLGPTRLAALAEGGPEALADLIENTVDAPLWIADPALYGLRDALPADAAGNVTAFRDSLWALTERINEALLGALDDLPGAPADVTVTSEQARTGVDNEDIEATLKVAGAAQPGQTAGEITSDVPPADTSGDAPKDVLDGENATAPKGDDQKVTNGGQIKGGQFSKAIERSIDRVGDRLNDAADDLRDGIKKALTPPSKTTTVDNDDTDNTSTEPAA